MAFSDRDLLISTPMRPGADGSPFGQLSTSSTALSAFVPIAPQPGLGLRRINLDWIAATFDGFQIVFGPSDAAITVGSFTGQPVFRNNAPPIVTMLITPQDAGFKIRSTGTDTDNLYWWIG